MKNHKIIIFILLGVAIYSCNSKSNQSAKADTYPDSSIDSGEISLICMDSIPIIDSYNNKQSIITHDGKVVIFEDIDLIDSEFRNPKDTIINNLYIQWSTTESYDLCDLIGPYDADYHDTPNKYTADTLIYLYGARGEIIINRLSSSKVVTDTIILSNYALRKCVLEDRELCIYYKSEVDHPLNKYCLLITEFLEQRNDTLRFELYMNMIDSDLGFHYYYDWTANGDSLYLIPDPYDDYDPCVDDKMEVES